MIKHIEYSDNPIIVIEPGKRGGKPCIRDLRITVYDVLVHLASGITPDVPLEYVEARVATVKFSH